MPRLTNRRRPRFARSLDLKPEETIASMRPVVELYIPIVRRDMPRKAVEPSATTQCMVGIFWPVATAFRATPELAGVHNVTVKPNRRNSARKSSMRSPK